MIHNKRESTMSDFAQALIVAIHVHAAQVDRQGKPYLLHVLRVVEAVNDEAKIVAALHDVLEDGGAEGARLVLALSLSPAEGYALKLLTHPTRMTYERYIAEIAMVGNSWIAREVKLADLRDNLERIPPEPPVVSQAVTVDEILTEPDYDQWVQDWSGLKRRYEKAIAILESAQ